MRPSLILPGAGPLPRALLLGAVLLTSASPLLSSASPLPLHATAQIPHVSPDAAHVLRVSPGNGASEVPRATPIVVFFDRPIVPLAALESPSAAPARITPALPGHGRWLNTSTWAWYPAGALRGATIYTVSVPAGLAAQDGTRLAAPFQSDFSTPRPAVVRVTPADGEQYADFRAPVTVRFNQDIDRAAAAAAFTLRDGAGRPVAGTMTWPRGDTLVFHPRRRLDLGATYQVGVSAALRSAEGALGPSGPAAWSFTTAGALRVEGTTPFNGDTAADMRDGISIAFSAPVDARLLRRHLRLIPSPDNQFISVTGDGTSVTISGGFAPSTHYHLALDGMIGADGQALLQPLRLGFITTKLAPALQLQYSSNVVGFDAYRPVDVALSAVNVRDLNLALYPLTREEYVGLVASPTFQTFFPSLQPLYTLHRRLSAPLNKTIPIGQDLTGADGRPLRPGYYYLLATDNGVARDSMAFIVTRSSVTLKTAPGRVLVWATDLRSGRPLPGLAVRVIDPNTGGLVAAGHTDADGVLDEATTQSGQGNGLVALLDRPGDAALCSSYWSGGVGAGDFGLPQSYGLSPHQGYLYTDRPIYRPGQPVRFRGLIRRDDDGAYGLPTAGTPVLVTLTDPTYHEIFRQHVRLDRMGAFAGSVTLSANASLGWDNLNAQVGNQSFSMPLQVAAYRKPDYTVSVAPASPGSNAAVGGTAGNATAGRPVRVAVTARYLFGAPLNRARVHWSVLGGDLYFAPPSYPDYVFQDYPFIPYQPFGDYGGAGAGLEGYPARSVNVSYPGPYFPGGPCYGCGGYYPGGSNLIAQGDTRTDSAGNLSLVIPPDRRRYALSQQWSVEADVRDVNNASISAHTVVEVHRAASYIGLRGPSALVTTGKPATVDLLTLGQDGATLVPDVAVSVAIYRRSYHTVMVHQQWGDVPEWLPVDTLVERLDGRTGANARGTVLFVPPSDGEYRVVAEARDSDGNVAHSALSLYAVGPDVAASPWNNPPSDHLKLVPDRRLYRIGQVAHLLVAAPRADMTALVTIERGRVYSHRVLRFRGASPVLSVPILPGYLPDVFVSVVAVAGTGPRADTPLWKLGLAELPVDVRERRLTLTLRASTARGHPGEIIGLRLHAAGPDGRPVQGQFSLALVDEAVLSLAADQAPAILDGFYSERGLGVVTAYSRNIAANQLPASASPLPAPARAATFLSDQVAHKALSPGRGGGGGGGGSGGVAASAPRAYFPDTAYWNPRVSTDAAGNAAVSVRLPDSLTTWRIEARGLTADTLVGQTSLDILSTRDLLLRPVLPRFFALNDRVQVGAVVNNTTARPLAARVSLALSGDGAQTGAAPAPVALTVPANGERLVTWPLRPRALGQVRLLLAVAAPGVTGDSVLVGAPVEPNSTPEVVATSGEVGAAPRVETVRVPVGAELGEGGLTLTLQPSLAAGLRSGVDYLRHYAWESNEDLAARVMGEVALLRLSAIATGLDATTLAAYRADLRATIDNLAQSQRANGGWGWWSSDDYRYSSPPVSTFVLDALGVAHRAGFAVPASVLRAAANYIDGEVGAAVNAPLAAASVAYGPDAVTPDLANYMGYVLDANGGHSPADALYAVRNQAPLWTRAYLLRALRLQGGGVLDARARTVLDELEAGAHLDAAGAHWENAGGDATMESPIQATAVALDALLEADPHSPLIAPATRWLVAARGGDSWPTTVGNALALRALSDELRGSGGLAGRYSYAVMLSGRAWGSGAVTPTAPARTRILSAGPIAQTDHAGGLAAGSSSVVRLARSNGSGRLYYTLRLAYYPPVERVASLSRGVSIFRQYLYHGHPVDAAPAGAVLTVRLSITSPQDLYYVALEDPLPAGAEAIDPTLLTTSQLQTRGYTVPKGIADLAWYADHAELRDDRAAVFAPYLPAGSYRYEYSIMLTTRGTFHALPAHIAESYFPEVFGRSAGGYFTVQ